jgi:hypothetical protein
MVERDSSKRWDTVGLAFPGALLGIIVGGMREIWEAYFHSSIEQESFAYIFAEVTVASIVGALLFAVVAEIRNRLSFRADHVAAKKDQHRPR